MTRIGIASSTLIGNASSITAAVSVIDGAQTVEFFVHQENVEGAFRIILTFDLPERAHAYANSINRTSKAIAEAAARAPLAEAS